MADTKLTYVKFEYIIDNPDFTEVRITYKSDEPGHPIWGGGEKRKRYSSKYDVVALQLGPIALAVSSLEFLHWNNDDSVEEYQRDDNNEEALMMTRREYMDKQGFRDTNFWQTKQQEMLRSRIR